jgi:hypothetical protein
MLIIEGWSGPILVVRAEGRLDAGAYSAFEPAFEREIAKCCGPILLLLELAPDFGWTAGGLWRDLRFDFHHRKTFARIAVLGHRNWHRWLTSAGKLLFSGEMRYFDGSERRSARAWLRS